MQKRKSKSISFHKIRTASIFMFKFKITAKELQSIGIIFLRLFKFEWRAQFAAREFVLATTSSIQTNQGDLRCVTR